MTFTGSGSATSASRSPPPLATRVPVSSSASRLIIGRRPSTMRAVNALDTRRLNRVCVGGSTSSIPARIRSQKGLRNSGSGSRPNSSWDATCRYVRPSRRSRSSASTSSYRLITHWSVASW